MIFRKLSTTPIPPYRRLFAALLVLPLALTGCGGEDQDDSGAGEPASDLSFAVVSHGGAGDKFWDVVKSGAEQAGEDLGVEVSYQGSGDPNQQSQLIDTAVSEKVDGIVVSMANPDALKEAIGKAVAAGIPVITINSGAERSKEFGALTHVGQTERIAGEAAGERLKAEGGGKALCVIHEAGNVGLEDRCAGAKAKFGELENLQVNVSDLADASSKIKAKLQSDTSIDAVLTLNNGVAIAARDAIRDASSKAKLATFDLDKDVLAAVKAGEISFAVDQQPYLQGYLPISFLLLYNTNANSVGGGQPVLTGPGFVDKSNADTVAEYAEKGTR
ncbi:MAG TPA: sugar ABC transporter substrate-binding protein [Micromonosporaceae bacterium]|nr:sugar ABC transporter substrate-binding protein [Micromonosporaceae bacterium]